MLPLFEGLSNLGQVHGHRVCKDARPAAARSPEENDRGLPDTSGGEQRPEVGVRRNKDPILVGGTVEDSEVGSVLQTNITHVNGVVTQFGQANRQARRQRVVDQEPHSPAASGSVRSRIASAA